MFIKVNGHTVVEYYTISIKDSVDVWHSVPLVFGHITHAAVAAAWLMHCSHSFIGASGEVVFPHDFIPCRLTKDAEFRVTALRDENLPADVLASLPSDEETSIVFEGLVKSYAPVLIKAANSTKKGFLGKLVDKLRGYDLGYWGHR